MGTPGGPPPAARRIIAGVGRWREQGLANQLFAPVGLSCVQSGTRLEPSKDDFTHTLGRITMAPYIVKAMALIGVKRRAGSNMFRHQLSTMAILLDYKIIDPILLKAAVIHDLF